MKLVVDIEYSKTYDKSACLVWVPPLEDFPSDVHSMFTDKKRQLQLEDIADLPIGHVPKYLSKFIRSVLDEDGKVYAIVTGDPVPSFSP